MIGEEFIDVLEEKGYSYETEGDKIVVTGGDDIKGTVWLDALKTLPPGVEFKNKEDVLLDALKTLPPGVVFNNRWDVYLRYIETIPPGVEFNNGGDVDLGSLIGGWFDDWKGNIEGIDSKRLLNLMIKQGVFI